MLLSHEGGKWSNPAFFNLGAITLGARAGGAVGPLTMMLMSDEAVQRFLQENSFSLDASAGLSNVSYAAVERTGIGEGDVIVWSKQEGAFAGATIGVTDNNRPRVRGQDEGVWRRIGIIPFEVTIPEPQRGRRCSEHDL